MAATPSGKDHIEKYARLYIGGVDLSGDARTFGNADSSSDAVSMRGWSNDIDQVLATGWRQVGITGFKAFMNDTSITGAFTVLKNNPTNELILAFGGSGEPAVPDPCYLLTGVQLGDKVAPESAANMITADFMASSTVSTNGNPWGVILNGPTVITSTTTGSSHDNGAATTNGGHAIIQAIGTISGTWDVTIEDSANDSTWATILTFTSITAIGDQHIAISGTVRRYVRAVLTETVAGTAALVVGFARN